MTTELQPDPTRAPRAVTFDYGQTIARLDTTFLSRRVAEHAADVDVAPAALDAAMGDAWDAYDAAIQAGISDHPWALFMRHLLEGAGVASRAAEPLADWLWHEQPRRNLWRRPVPGMLDLVRDLHHDGVRVGIISNSEGNLAALIDELGWRDLFPVVADSGRLGFDKPDPRIFRWTCEQLGVRPEETIHVGDSWPADVAGALAVGMRAIHFASERLGAVAPERGVAFARDASEVRAALRAWGIDPAG
jgi:HAD superfamily hydrolase (TIGR01509 family)